jgi:hypothetical protein
VPPKNGGTGANAGNHPLLASGPSDSNSFGQAVESKELNLPATVLANEGWRRIGGDDQKAGFSGM